MSDEAALLKAIIAHADEDTPRLAYADWLDENGDPERAAFIRVQCRLAEMSPAHPEWFDLRDQEDELTVRLQPRFKLLASKATGRFYFYTDTLADLDEEFRRGFPYSVAFSHRTFDWTADDANRVATELANLVRTTTFRSVFFANVLISRLPDIFKEPAAAQLTGLGLRHCISGTEDRPTAMGTLCRFIATHPNLRGIQRLLLEQDLPAPAVAELAQAAVLDSVRHFTVDEMNAPREVIECLTRAPWFRGLRYFRCRCDEVDVAVPLVEGLGRLPDLHTVDLVDLSAGATAALTSGKFPALANIGYGGSFDNKSAKLLAKAKFPALRFFRFGNGLTPDALLTLLKAKWFEQLRALGFIYNTIGDAGVKALAAHPVAKSLRVLQLGGGSGLTVLAKADAFPELTALNLSTHTQWKGATKKLVTFLSALRLTRLRYLGLRGLPIGDEGAKALASNPVFATLTQLNLEECDIGDPGAKALFASPHLQNLVELQLGYNRIKTGAGVLADRTVMPRLGACDLDRNDIPAKTLTKIRRRGLHVAC